jgi:hypothetical protein
MFIVGYELNVDRRKHQKCENCIFEKSCYIKETQMMQEKEGLGNDCTFYQDERDLPPWDRTARYDRVKDLPPYTVRIKRPI